MPPVRKFEREEILDVALEIVKKEGMTSLNARKLASELGSSVQPIFHNFNNMQELTDAVRKRIYDKYKEYMTPDVRLEKPYKQIGLGYIRFAKDYPEFFKLLYMQKTELNALGVIMADGLGDDIIRAGQELTWLSYELQKKFHVKVWMFTHGIASLLATGTISMSDDEIEEMLESTVRQMTIGFKMEENDK